jgi:hypothetical protein
LSVTKQAEVVGIARSTVYGSKVGRRRVRTLMSRMGIEALYRPPRTTKPEPGHKIYPYLLRGLEITRPNQVRAMETSQWSTDKAAA